MIPDLRPHFSRFLQAAPGRLHFAAHSHHAWPDVTRDAQLQAWDDAARLMDDKWDHILGPVLDEFRGHVARHLRLPDPATVIVGPNTHEFLRRLLSCFPAGRPVRVLSTDAEFHTFGRQVARWEEDGLVRVVRVPAAPFASFAERFAAEAGRPAYDLVFLSEVFFNSGYAADIDAVAAAAHPDAMLVVDGYHGFMARPTNFSGLANRAFYMSGGYKYAMAGEGACFLHCPPGWGARPRDTGWYAAFGALAAPQDGTVPYAADGWRFMGATFDPSGLYRFNAAMRWLARLGIGPAELHAHAVALGERLVRGLPPGCGLSGEQLVVALEESRRGNFLTFDTRDAPALHRRLHAAGVQTDVRGTRLRFGFGPYLVVDDVRALHARLAAFTRAAA